MTTQLVDVSSYDWSTLPDCGFFEVLGKRGTGKTTWTQHMLQSSRFKDTGMFVAMTGSEVAKRTWSSVIHPIFVVEPSIAYLETLRDAQNTCVRDHENSDTDAPFDDACHVTLILDDVSSNKKLMRSQILAYLASNSRHLQMSIFILVQYHCQLVTEVRNQFDSVFALSTADDKSIKRIHAEYCSLIELRLFRLLLSQATQNHGMFIIDNQAKSMDISSVCFYSRMAMYPPTLDRLGSDEAWSFGTERFVPDHEHKPSVECADDWAQANHSSVTVKHDRVGKVIIRML